ncbi:CIA30 family protein [Marinicella litoralis]|uniref:Complex I intermediate-associated protein 30 (CIA30) n=2 Tax=Marinicella litoralis TaxID=644220 RepID=A0A4R6XWN6_9GAMM|nr:CIA30 family protein [Marinicella litoralis]TDR22567.1 complex I intermediate-associated protein 30 (CIA30) [Marinicella litoralis]
MVTLSSTLIEQPDLYRFNQLQTNQFMIVNDGVMGGKSKSELIINNTSATFSGVVSTENNGGFASVRILWPFNAEDSEGKQLLSIKVNGDGHQYQLRLRTNNSFDGAAYRHTFDTLKGQDTVVTVPLEAFKATFRGRELSDQPALEFGNVKQMGILIAEKQTGPFIIKLNELSLH